MSAWPAQGPRETVGLLRASLGSPGCSIRIMVVFTYTHTMFCRARWEISTEHRRGLAMPTALSSWAHLFTNFPVTQRASCHAQEKSGHAPGCWQTRHGTSRTELCYSSRAVETRKEFLFLPPGNFPGFTISMVLLMTWMGCKGTCKSVHQSALLVTCLWLVNHLLGDPHPHNSGSGSLKCWRRKRKKAVGTCGQAPEICMLFVNPSFPFNSSSSELKRVKSALQEKETLHTTESLHPRTQNHKRQERRISPAFYLDAAGLK